ncbi:SAP domain-containing ribonucleoprotein [Strongylocentrotus purpuratus]|uniref:SAP domain-containing protein n=1 Tax=Strongylocentrotus purpuratus TaxID=7668 RepID=A0A7M7P4B2_STRPU|nr:SAP domain-containing ribonucleoprotein [Strongylocentrotus purpuratus]
MMRRRGRHSEKMADVEVKKLKIAELRKELTDRGLSSKGNKAELAERLAEILDGSGGDAVLDNSVLDHEVDADVLTADDEVDDEVEDLLNQDEDLDGGDEGEEDTAATRKVEVEIEEEEAETKVEAPEIKKVISPTTKSMTDTEKKALRAQKFGVAGSLSDADKKKARAERFGMKAPESKDKPTAAATPTSKGISVSVDTDKLKQRAERFGKSVSPPAPAIKGEEAERIRKRKERFGAVTISGPGSKAKTNAAGGDDAEAKKRKRAERFGMA